MTRLLPALAILLATIPPAFGQSSPAVNAGRAGCQPGQVLQPGGEPCLPPGTIAAPAVNVLGPTPAEMSRLLAVTPPATTAAACPAGQVLQPNGQPCQPRPANPGGRWRP